MCDNLPYLNLGPIVPTGLWDKLYPDHKSPLNQMYRDLFKCLQRAGGRVDDWNYADSWNYDLNNNSLDDCPGDDRCRCFKDGNDV